MNQDTRRKNPEPAPTPYFDDDEMLQDYIDDDDEFGEPPPSPSSPAVGTVKLSSTIEEDFLEEMIEQQNNEKECSIANPEPQINATTTAATTTTTTATERSSEEITNSLGDGDDVNNNITHDTGSTVEEYIAARNQNQSIYNFERYKKNSDWRKNGPSSSISSNQQLREQYPSSLSSIQMKMRSGGCTSKTVAPAARFLRLLEFNNRCRNHQGRKKSQQQIRLKRGGVFQTPKENISTVPVTIADGSRVYIRCNDVASTTNTTRNENKDKTRNSIVTTATNNSATKPCSLGVSMKELFRRVDVIKRRNISNAAAIARRRLEITGNNNNNKIGKDKDDMLWVDKHAPSSFPHLLSDERTNREVLRALRGWDPYVFNRSQPLRPLYQRQREQEKQQQQQQQQQNSGTFKKKDDKINNNPHDTRPVESSRVILLSGAPGVGKTTLAHIVARHAGYRPVEVNASDERSAGVLKDRIQSAMESTTINFELGANAKSKFGKPNCLILDEIDGVDVRGSIEALVGIIKAEIPSKTNSKHNQTKNSTPSSGKKSTCYLRRPIICICNHKYAPALKPLLPYACHFNVDPPSPARLVARLKAILNDEKRCMMGGGSLLNQLVVSSGGDIRSCIFTLQFATETDNFNDPSQALMNALSGSGLKDNRNDITGMITTVFRKTKPKTVDFTSGHTSTNETDRARVSFVMDAVDHLGDDSMIVNALFMNVPRVSYIDPAFDRCSAALELLSFAGDQRSRYSVPIMTAGIHLLCRVEVKPNLSFSRESNDMKYKQESNLRIIQKFLESLPAKAKNLKCNALLAEEFIPLALWILSAGQGSGSLSRPASSIDILTKMERDSANNHVAVLCALGLTYVLDDEQKNDDVSSFRAKVSEMRLEPPIHNLIEYKSLNCYRKQIPNQLKELLAHQCLLDGIRIRNSSSKKQLKSVEKSPSDLSEMRTPKLVKSPNAESLSSDARVVPRKLDEIGTSLNEPTPKRQKSTPSPTAGNFLVVGAKKGKAAKSARRAAALGLNRYSSRKLKLAHTGSGLFLQNAVRMKYVKGFTQAVRTPCRLNDLE